jgi:hypothetical protein
MENERVNIATEVFEQNNIGKSFYGGYGFEPLSRGVNSGPDSRCCG